MFDKKQIKIMWYEDIKTRPVEFMQELYRFIGVDDSFVPDNINETFEFSYHKDEATKKLTLSDQDRKKWLKYYLPHTEELERMTGKDLSHWKV